MKVTIIRFVYSSFITFIATFVAVAIPQYLDGNFEWGTGAAIGVSLAAVRLGVKASWENLAIVLPKVLSYAKSLLKK